MAVKTAVLYISLGRYDVFFEGFYKSAVKNLLTGHEKHFFVFTDSESVKKAGYKNVTVIFQKKLGWPLDTLMRFEMFSSIKKELAGFDYIYFFNSNMEFLKPVSEEILPGDGHGGLAASIFFIKSPDEYTYDRNPLCRAYIPFGKGKTYYQGGLNGGRAKDYLAMISALKDMVDADLKENQIAVCHDESYLNKYLLDKSPLILERNYIYPEQWNPDDCPGEMKIKLRDKDNPVYGGASWLRGATDKKMTVLKALINHPIKVIKNIIKRRNWWKFIS